MSLFKKILHEDLERVFMNELEFAEEHEIGGVRLSCMVDEKAGQADGSAADGFQNASSLGLLCADRVVYCVADDLGPIPLPGQKIVMDGQTWLAGDGVSVMDGLLALPLLRNY